MISFLSFQMDQQVANVPRIVPKNDLISKNDLIPKSPRDPFSIKVHPFDFAKSKPTQETTIKNININNYN